MRVLGAIGAAAAALVLAGCSQIGGLAPVSGDSITMLRTAAYDVLLQNKVPILVAPTCTEGETSYSCAGSTEDGTPITVTAPLAKPLVMTVSVGDTVLYTGDVISVVQSFAEVAP